MVFVKSCPAIQFGKFAQLIQMVSNFGLLFFQPPIYLHLGYVAGASMTPKEEHFLTLSLKFWLLQKFLKFLKLLSHPLESSPRGSDKDTLVINCFLLSKD